MTAPLRSAPLLFLVPVHNEAESLAAVIDDVRTRFPDGRVIVVDDASTDDSPDIAERLADRLVRLPRRAGVGAAIRRGLQVATQDGYSVVVRLDGDGQHPTEQLPTLLAPIHAGTADVVVGSRYLDAGGYDTPWLRRGAQRCITGLLRWLDVPHVSDPTSGYWVVGPRALAYLARHHPRGYAEPGLRLRLRQQGLRVVEVPVRMHSRRAGRSKLTLRVGGTAFLWMMGSISWSALRHRHPASSASEARHDPR